MSLKGFMVEASAEYLLKYVAGGEEEAVLLTGSELKDLLNTGLIDDEQVSWISLEIPTGFVTYSFLDKEWSVEDES